MRRHQPGRRIRKKRQPEVIVLAPRKPSQAPAPDDEALEAPAPERERDRRREVLADMQEEARRWR